MFEFSFINSNKSINYFWNLLSSLSYFDSSLVLFKQLFKISSTIHLSKNYLISFIYKHHLNKNLTDPINFKYAKLLNNCAFFE